MKDSVKNNPMEKPEPIYKKYGAMKDKEPLFTPDARGLFIVTSARKEPDEDALIKVNLHAQSVLKEESEEYKRAQEWWSNLPKTPARQRENLGVYVPTLDATNEDVQAWIDDCDAFDGLVYIFVVERKLNLRTNSTQTHIPVTAFNFQNGFFVGTRSLDDIEEDDCVNYRMYFAYFEKPETLTRC